MQTDIIQQVHSSNADSQTPYSHLQNVCIQIEKLNLVYEDIKDDQQKFMFYTGICDSQISETFFGTMMPLHRWVEKQVNWVDLDP